MHRVLVAPATLHRLGLFSVPGGEAGFGITTDLAGNRAWAYGPAPEMDLRQNQTISGTVTWEGLMVGRESSLGGLIRAGVELSIELEDLLGELEFTHLRYLTPGESR